MTLTCGGKRTDVCLSATSYYVPELHTDTVVLIINSIGRIQSWRPSNRPTPHALPFGNIIGRSETFLEAARRAENAAYSESNVLLTGESGVGKDVWRRRSTMGRRRKDPCRH